MTPNEPKTSPRPLSERCPTCDRVVATEEDAASRRYDPNNPRNWDVVCWNKGSRSCLAHAVDWRKRAMDLAAEVASLRSIVGAYRASSLDKRDEWLREVTAQGYARGIEDAATALATMRNNPAVKAGPARGCIHLDDAIDRIRSLATKRSNDDGK